MKQGSFDWLEWRRQGIGSSDSPVVMKVSPWKTPFQLWEEKTNRTKDKEASWAMERGTELEPKARANYEILRDLDMPPTLAVHNKYPFLRASLDGFNKDKKKILEIKCPGQKDHEQAVSGLIPEKYIYQIVHQLLVTDAESVDYFSF